jgi:hypothetical protein
LAKSIIEDPTLYDYDSFYDQIQQKRKEIDLVRKVKVIYIYPDDRFQIPGTDKTGHRGSQEGGNSRPGKAGRKTTETGGWQI